ncbi:high mobility group B1 [Trifolium repens]|nr:high mobility group B1 [Trifolium repens]
MKGGKSKGESKKAETKLAVNKKGAPATKGGRKPTKGKKPAKGKKPERPGNDFFVFIEEFRKENPNNKAVSDVCKAAVAKWKSLSEAEKAKYAATAEKTTPEYENVRPSIFFKLI